MQKDLDREGHLLNCGRGLSLTGVAAMKTEINLRTREFIIAREFYLPRFLAHPGSNRARGACFRRHTFYLPIPGEAGGRA